jgi:hypothetical protein
MARKAQQRPAGEGSLPGDTFAARYLHIAGWVLDGWIEIGPTDYTSSFVRALDEGGLVWEGDTAYPSIEAALQALDAAIAAWQEAS